MTPDTISDLGAMLHGRTTDRRDFILRAATGLSVGLSGATLARTNALAVQATPAPADASDRGECEGEHEMGSGSEHYVLADDDAEAIWFLGTLATIKGIGAQTGESLALVEFTHPLGFATPRHVHHTADEAFYVLAGAMRGYCGDEPWQATTGSFVWLPRGIPHSYAVDGEETLRTLAITTPAGFNRFVVEGGEPARERTMPLPSVVPDIEKLEAAGARYGIETLGPPESYTDSG